MIAVADVFVQAPLAGIDQANYRSYVIERRMKISFDPAKRELTLWARGLDFGDAEEVFAGPTFTFEDARLEPD